mmetsp:Transcript_37097/g.87303  ORF Transcript_37097/g.87303 Transcript_37097/m.87303 type:complete len:267 (-) Transcript_37097:559-1359(-)
MQRERELLPRKRFVTSGPNRMQFCPRCAAFATPGKSQGSAQRQSNMSDSSIDSVDVGHCRRRFRFRRCCTWTASRRKRPPCTTNTRSESTVASGSTSKSCWNIMKRAGSCLLLTSSKNPPPWSALRRFISMFSWLPRFMLTISGYRILNMSVMMMISHAFSPRSAMSPFSRYPVVGEGSPFCLRTQRKSASWPCVSPQMTSFPSSPVGTFMSQTDVGSISLKSWTPLPRISATYLSCTGSSGLVRMWCKTWCTLSRVRGHLTWGPL